MPTEAYIYAGKSVSLSTDFVSVKDGSVVAGLDGKIYIENKTPNAGTTGEVVVTINIPAGLTYTLLSATPSLGTVDESGIGGGVLVWTIPDIAFGATEDLDLDFTVDSSCCTDLEVTYTAALSAGGEVDTTNNSSISRLEGIPCDDVKPCINILEYLTLGDGLTLDSGTGTSADPAVIDGLFISADADNLLNTGGDGGVYLNVAQIEGAITPTGTLGTH